MDKSIADKYLRIYQKLCLGPFLFTLVSLLSTFIGYADANLGFLLSFFLIRGLDQYLQLVYLWVIGIGIVIAFLFLSAYAAKGKWWLLYLSLTLFVADTIYGIFIYKAMPVWAFYLGLTIHLIFIGANVANLIFAYKTQKALKEEGKH